ncbi:MAG: preprotein translocase subunit YajC [Clostridia bacterium]|nr:preprotein translocase subunit YajC [Clostridia bacterium]
MFLLNLLEGQANTNPQTPWGTYVFLGLMVLILVYMFIRGRKQKKEQAVVEQKKEEAFKVGAKIVTIGGIVGTIVKINEDESFVIDSEGSLIKLLDKRAYWKSVEENSLKVNGQKAEEPKEEVKEETKA